MGKSKTHSLARLPKDQRCQFLIGPISSWFLPDTSDLWTRPTSIAESSTNKPETAADRQYEEGEIEDDDSMEAADESHLSYFAYGSVGCFCYGEIHQSQQDKTNQLQSSTQFNSMSAIVSHLVDIREDNSRVICLRFLRPSLFPIIMILTESGSFMIHDCIKEETLIHMRKNELISRFIGPSSGQENNGGGEHHNKRAKFNVIQQINSFVWPNATNAFLGISLLKEKTNLLIWIKIKDLRADNQSQLPTTKPDYIDSHQKLDLDLPQYSSPICCMESILLDHKSCLLAVAMDDGLIKVVMVDLKENEHKRTITLARHNDQICSISLYLGDRRRFPLGLLASVSRNGLTLLWDIENEFYFADYQAAGSSANSRLNWFSLSFVSNKEANATNLAISNSDSGLTVLEIPENTRSKIRLKEPIKEKQQKGAAPALRHQALIFNVIYDPVSQIMMTSSLDGNHILWTSQKSESQVKQPIKKTIGSQLEVKSQYSIPSLPNNSRVHMMRHSPIQESLLGLCLGKAGVRFYKIAENLAQSKFDMNQGASLIARKITKASLCPTSLSWHPRNEYRVAIGTIEGKVLRVDLTPNRSSMIETEDRKTNLRKTDSSDLMPIDHEQTGDDLFGVDYQPITREADSEPLGNMPKTDGIYSICWGPNPSCAQDENRLAIYAVGSITHRLSIYYSKKEASDKLTDYLNEFLDESLPEAIGEASEIAWKSTFDLMALGTTHGKVIIAEYLEESHADRSRNRLFRKLAVIKQPMGTTYIQCLVWHPTLDEEDSRYHHIACSSNESPVFVFDVRGAREDSKLVSDVRTKLKIENSTSLMQDNVSVGGPIIISDPLYKLDAHKRPISDVAWNPHNASQLATCSFDRSCYVWSLDESSDSAKLCSKFCARDRLFTLEWSLVDDDLLYTSGHEATVWAWRPSENLHKTSETQSS